jgi:hypothetical protein
MNAAQGVDVLMDAFSDAFTQVFCTNRSDNELARAQNYAENLRLAYNDLVHARNREIAELSAYEDELEAYRQELIARESALNSRSDQLNVAAQKFNSFVVQERKRAASVIAREDAIADALAAKDSWKESQSVLSASYRNSIRRQKLVMSYIVKELSAMADIARETQHDSLHERLLDLLLEIHDKDPLDVFRTREEFIKTLADIGFNNPLTFKALEQPSKKTG